MNSVEEALIESLKRGNHQSFEQIFKTYYSRLCSYSFGYTKQFETAEDIVKNVFIHFWENREKISIKTSLSGYLFRAVHNASINYLERERKRNIISLTEDFDQNELRVREPLSSDYPVGNLLAKELEDIITSEIEKLPKQCREIFILSRFDGLSHKEIAEKKNISENTVKVQIFRALKKIKEAISILLTLSLLLFR